ncbi:hypothetical protein HK100_003754 [Physocladia obscura]|uniref:Uncharacterized protein n=1 Tax=Physocladia obscura TaxID=109957 RepID=A0AAD5STR4_9FUNG|nr:hypothetical protein HK100_003754 [Physocladia obscura]
MSRVAAELFRLSELPDVQRAATMAEIRHRDEETYTVVPEPQSSDDFFDISPRLPSVCHLSGGGTELGLWSRNGIRPGIYQQKLKKMERISTDIFPVSVRQ